MSLMRHSCLTNISKKTPTAYLFILWINLILKVLCQSSDNTPPLLQLDRNWIIPSTETVGSVVTRVRAFDVEDDPLIFGLQPVHHGPKDTEPENPHLPFTIDNSTGVVYLNESLKDRGGKDIFLYVTVSDGKLTAKNEVWVRIENGTGGNSGQGGFFPGKSGNTPRVNPPFLSLPGFNSRIPPPPPNFNLFPLNNRPNIPDYTRPVERPNNSNHRRVQTKTYIEDEPDVVNVTESTVENKTTTQLHAINPLVPRFEFPPGTKPVLTKDSNDKDNHLLTNEVGSEGNAFNATEDAVKSAVDLTATIVPLISVCAVFLVVGLFAVLFRKKYAHPGRRRRKPTCKEAGGGIVLQEAPQLAIQRWRVPRAFSNRYESQSKTTSDLQTTPGSVEEKGPVDRWEFPRHHLKVFDILGEGAFGQVWRCEAMDIDGKVGPSTVAVKTLKENASEKERLDLISELQVMKTLQPHPNVVRLLACCTEKEPVFVVMEYISLGKLQAFLRASRAERHYGNIHAGSDTLTSRDLTSFVYQVAKGMDYLSSKGIIHRDLAARNILITDDHVCKVADFGFARDLVTSQVYERKSEGRLPIRWMAPESLYDDIFSVKSDVWSFGVLIWEVVTLGSTPYPGLSAGDVMRKVRDGYRLEKPEHCRRELYNIMFYCWDKDPAQRPTFAECITLLERLLMTETDYIELERFPDHSYYNVVSLSGEKL